MIMGARHLDLGWGKTLWTHMWIDHMYAYVAQWGTIARFSKHAERLTERLPTMGSTPWHPR